MILRSARVLSLALTFALPLATLAATPSIAGDDVVKFATDDSAMNRATAEARASLGATLDHLRQPDGSYPAELSLKVGFPIDHPDINTEVIWIDSLSDLPDGQMQGRFANAPNAIAGASLGSAATFARAEVQDWSYYDGRTLYGNYTTRAMLPHLEEAQAAQLRQLLSQTPTLP
ncbi:DUF2314 domain-containing protein [Thalassobius sp. Cn5-15]|uniref:DUF2314 domain-containing protein n=1 Tax=Thalassobius sp. Cn5-15 TaxID=2917763 RepID=UPI001EF2F266|nr:DUF2314 domain-containing protein [Thalassobius sp. Cn5-15]MCG7494719.1 DUF2314 domain-containing protein [Thalassobius sp. Cn5-15]